MIFNYTDFIIQGFCKTEYEYINRIPIDIVHFDKREETGVSYPATLPYEMTMELMFLKEAIQETVLQVFDTVELLKRTGNQYGLWDGTEPTSTIWHNDYLEGGTMLALVYFDNIPEDGSGGGAFHVTNNGGIHDCHKTNPDKIYTMIPQRGDVIFITHNRDIDHKVDYATVSPRLVMSVGINCRFEGDQNE